MVKSPDPLDPSRIEVESVAVATEPVDSDGYGEHAVLMTVVFRYSPWEPSRNQDVLWEQANALQALKKALDVGGIGEE